MSIIVFVYVYGCVFVCSSNEMIISLYIDVNFEFLMVLYKQIPHGRFKVKFVKFLPVILLSAVLLLLLRR